MVVCVCWRHQRENADGTAFVDGIHGVYASGTWSGQSSKLPEALHRIESVCGRTLFAADPAVRVCRLSGRGAHIHSDGSHRQRRFSAQVRRARHHARRVQLRLFQQRREEVPQTQQGSLLRGIEVRDSAHIHQFCA